MKKKRKQTKPKPKPECEFKYTVTWRHLHSSNGPAYCLRVLCETHGHEWTALTDTTIGAKLLADNFPLVRGGMCFDKGCYGFPIPQECIIGQIQESQIQQGEK